jgi:predicted extracellular nuclease
MKLHRLACSLIGALVSTASLASVEGVVISQVYGGGGNTGAVWRRDFIELFNAGTAPVNLNGWSVQYGSAAGTAWAVTPLTGVVLQPGQYHLVQQAAGAGGSQDLPAADSAGSIAMSATNGKVALVSNITALSGGNPSGAGLVDLVGFGTATGFEGAVAAAPSNTLGLLRALQGCIDTNNNASDFATATPGPRNSASPVQVCGGGGTNLAIVPSCPAVSVAAGTAAVVNAQASDADSIVNNMSVLGSLPAGFSVGGVTPAAADGGSATASFQVASSVSPATYNLALQWSNNEAQTASCTFAVTVSGITPIPAIQGTGAASPLVGQTVTTRGVVTKVNNNGFYIQDPVGDGNPLSSDGILVFTSTAPTVSVGNMVQFSAVVVEFNTGAASNAVTAARTVTELTNPTGLVVQSSGHVITPIVLSLPLASADALEAYEGMLVTLDGQLTVSQNYFLGRYGQLTLSAGGRLKTPTNVFRPGADAQALAAGNAARAIVLDDGSSLQNPNPIPFIGEGNTVRAGDTIDTLTGVVDYGLVTASNAGAGSYRLHPTQPPVIVRANARTMLPPAVGGNIKVASANVLNYFTTLASSGNVCAPSNTLDDCRGANSAEEFVRQRTKIVESLAAINADVVALMEMQNNGATAVQDLVNALNAKMGSTLYAAVPDPTTGAATGTDAIKVALIYKPSRLSRVGASVSDAAAVHNRPPLAQSFAALNGEKFSVVVNHFKSKGCAGASGADADQGDLQGCFNARRVLQAQALRNFVSTVQATSGSDDILLLGDFNAYAFEDPIHELTSNGFVDQIGRFNVDGYSYVFDGAAGRLDSAIASVSLSARTTGAVEWHINADEPFVIDYNLEFKPQDLYSATPYRSSDHDPVVLGLSLVKTIMGTAGKDTLVGTAGDDVIIGGEGADLLTSGGGQDLFVYLSLRDAGDAVTDFMPGEDRLDLRALLVSIGYAGTNAVADGVVRFVAVSGATSVQIDADGASGPAAPRVLLTLRQVNPAQIVVARDILLSR